MKIELLFFHSIFKISDESDYNYFVMFSCFNNCKGTDSKNENLNILAFSFRFDSFLRSRLIFKKTLVFS